MIMMELKKMMIRMVVTKANSRDNLNCDFDDRYYDEADDGDDSQEQCEGEAVCVAGLAAQGHSPGRPGPGGSGQSQGVSGQISVREWTHSGL